MFCPSWSTSPSGRPYSTSEKTWKRPVQQFHKSSSTAHVSLSKRELNFAFSIRELISNITSRKFNNDPIYEMSFDRLSNELKLQCICLLSLEYRRGRKKAFYSRYLSSLVNVNTAIRDAEDLTQKPTSKAWQIQRENICCV